MKSIQESIIGRKGSKSWYKLPNPKLKDLQYLDVVKCANDNIYICIDPDRLHEHARIYDFDAYRIVNDPPIISVLGLYNYHQNLTCMSSKEYDIVAVYRGIFVNKDYPDFQTIWNILQERMKEII